MTARPEKVDTEAPWWRGFYQAWCEADDDPLAREKLTDDVIWSAGYDAGMVERHRRRRAASRRWN